MSAEASSSTSGSGDLQPQYTPEQIQALNKELESKTPQEILVWAIDNLEGLYQTTAFGLYVAHKLCSRSACRSEASARKWAMLLIVVQDGHGSAGHDLQDLTGSRRDPSGPLGSSLFHSCPPVLAKPYCSTSD